jgi:CheY-like chemotaxis protein
MQHVEGIMQEQADRTTVEDCEPSDLEGTRSPRESGLVPNDDTGPFTMRSEMSVPKRGISSTRVLICDDETRLVSLTAGLLRELGYEVLTVKSGEDAIECVARETVDVVILDVNLPGEDTLSIAKRLIANKVPAIVLSSGFTEEDVESDLLTLTGVRAFLAKPYGVDTLSATIQRVVEASESSEQL